MLILRVGDPHVKVSNLAESEKLMQFVLDTACTRKVGRIEILGDLLHTHAVIRLEVLEFWDKWINTLSSVGIDLVILVGNHDQTGDHNSSSHALSVFRLNDSDLAAGRQFTIVSEPTLKGVFAYVPYYHNHDQFISDVTFMATTGAKVLVCHQTLAGSTYENGFYAPDGINPDMLPYPLIISGHVHARQRFKSVYGDVIYPGTARWDSISDANQPKGLWLVNHDDSTGAIISEEFIDTSGVCEPIYSLIWTEGDPRPEIPDTGRISVELIGSSHWVGQQKADLKGKVALKSKITDKANAEVRQSGVNLQDFIKNLFVSNLDRERLLQYMKELDLV